LISVCWAGLPIGKKIKGDLEPSRSGNHRFVNVLD
jgi:hypothetical protein